MLGVNPQVAPGIFGVKLLQLSVTVWLNEPCALTVKLTGDEMLPRGSFTGLGNGGEMLQLTTSRIIGATLVVPAGSRAETLHIERVIRYGGGGPLL